MGKEKEASTAVDIPGSDVSLTIDLEGLKVAGVEQKDAEHIARHAASLAVEAVEAEYRAQITTLTTERDEAVQQAAAETRRADAAEAKVADLAKRAAFDTLFQEHAVPLDQRADLFEELGDLPVEKAEKVLKRFDARKALGNLADEQVDKDLKPSSETTTLADETTKVVEAGALWAEGLLGR